MIFQHDFEKILLNNPKNASMGSSMNGIIFNGFNRASVRSVVKLRTGSEAREG